MGVFGGVLKSSPNQTKIDSGSPSTVAASSPQTLNRDQKKRKKESGSRKITIAELMNMNQPTICLTKRMATALAATNKTSVVNRLTQISRLSVAFGSSGR